MYKTKITTGEDILKAIDVITQEISFHEAGIQVGVTYMIKLMPNDAEMLVETLEICANKFPEAK